MADQNHHARTLLGQETNFDNADQPGIAQPYTQSEVQDLLYGQDRPARDRLERLKELRAESAARESGDWGGQDPGAMLDELDRAIDELSTTMANADDGQDYADLDAPLATDQSGRLDALAPDDYDARREIEQGSVPEAAAEEEVAEVDEAAEDLDGKDSAA